MISPRGVLQLKVGLVVCSIALSSIKGLLFVSLDREVPPGFGSVVISVIPFSLSVVFVVEGWIKSDFWLVL
jgi:hypothetical protein